MNLPFKKSVFLELLRYPLFVDFARNANLMDIPHTINSVEFKGPNLKSYKLYIHRNIESAERVISEFLEQHPAFWGVVLTINKMAAEYTVGYCNSSFAANKRELVVFKKIDVIKDCIIQSKLPDFEPDWLRHRIDKIVNKLTGSFDFAQHLKNKIVGTQEETVNNLYDYAVSIADRFLPNFKAAAIRKLDFIMNTEDVLKTYFDRVVVINLDRRQDRWKAIQEKFASINWPFKEPERFSAYDGEKLPAPIGWTSGPGTWGCLLSHREVLSRAIQDGLNNVLILEDDIFFAPDFEKRVVNFIKGVPLEWDQLMLGGQYFDTSKAFDISPEVRKVSLCHRAHAYAVRGNFMKYTYSKLCASYGHVDHIMNTFQDRFHIYTPRHFLIGQDGSPSDISGAQASPDLMRNPPDKDTPVFVIAPDLDLHKQVFESGLPLHFGSLAPSGANARLQKLADKPPHDLKFSIFEFLNSGIWYARSVYPSKYNTILNPHGLLLEPIMQTKSNLNLIYIESLEQLQEAIAKYPFGENLPSQFPEDKQQS
jgi:Glycosyltransferase family 25 (LPS biosynthesis protein)